MESCLNCGRDSVLMLSIELRGESLAKYCLEPECLEAAKFTAGNMKGADKEYSLRCAEKGGG